MAKQFIIIFFMLSVCAWRAYAVVNCTATGAGRKADPADATCKNYTYCIYVSSNNTYVSYDYVCSTTSLFNPQLAQCTSNYTCPASTNNTTTNNTTTTSVCTADGFFADPNSTNCTSYIGCVNINGTYTETTYTCPDTTFYNPNTTLCDFNYNCTSTATFTCTTAGRFANTIDSTCQAYYFCVLLSNGTFIQYNLTCTSTSMFNPSTSQCTSNYTCPATTNNTTTNNTTTTSVCTADGFFADPNSTNCTSYIECVNINGTYTETTYTCPDTTFYNPNTTLCDFDYNCTSTAPFTCTTAGRFANTTDSTCQAYYFCVFLSNGTFIQYNLTCTSTSMFSPSTSQCTATYKCTN